MRRGVGVKTSLAVLSLALLSTPLLSGGAGDSGCGGGVTTAQSLCQSTGGTWDDGVCPVACWPPACNTPLGVACPAACGSSPVCLCPKSAPFWEDGQGCRTAQQCPGPLSCASVGASAFESSVFDQVNQERVKSGLAPLSCDASAFAAARQHSQAMCSAGFFSHTGPDGSTPATRLIAAGAIFAACGENIAAGPSTPTTVMQGWMNSPGHKSNILGAIYTHLGVGYISCSGGLKHYWTQDFLKP